jgi:hypothetical protein
MPGLVLYDNTLYMLPSRKYSETLPPKNSCNAIHISERLMNLDKRNSFILTAKLFEGRRTEKLSFERLTTCCKYLPVYLPRVTVGSLSLRIN